MTLVSNYYRWYIGVKNGSVLVKGSSRKSASILPAQKVIHLITADYFSFFSAAAVTSNAKCNCTSIKIECLAIDKRMTMKLLQQCNRTISFFLSFSFLAFSINAKPQENLLPHIYFEQQQRRKEKMGIGPDIQHVSLHTIRRKKYENSKLCCVNLSNNLR